jgi:uncharacterized protein with NRDE domain
MCLIAFAWKTHPDYELIVAANRDEWHDRPAAPAAWWNDHPQILAGRDLKAGGTWMGVTRSGRFAAITNFRDPADRKSTVRSRGELVTAFLLGDAPPVAFLTATKKVAHEYNGFNLIVGDGTSLAYFGSVDGAINSLEPGVYALSNHTLNEPWPKVTMAKSALDEALQAKMSEDARKMAIYAILSDTSVAPDDALPNTGVGIEWERVLSPALIITEKYGTRASTILSIANSGDVSFEERTRANDGAVGGVAKFRFDLRQS